MDGLRELMGLRGDCSDDEVANSAMHEIKELRGQTPPSSIERGETIAVVKPPKPIRRRATARS